MPLGNDIHHQVPVIFNKMQKLSLDGWVATDIRIDDSGFKLIWHLKEGIQKSKTRAKSTQQQAINAYQI